MNRHEQKESMLLSLPQEILHHLIPFLDLSSIALLCGTCQTLNSFLSEHAFRLHALHYLSYDPFTAYPHHNSWNWSWSKRLAWSLNVRERWQSWEMSGEVLSLFPRRCMPVVMLWDRGEKLSPRIVIGKGHKMEMWEVATDGRKNQVWEGTLQWTCPTREAEESLGIGRARKSYKKPLEEITAICPVAGHPRDLIVSFASGRRQRKRMDDDFRLKDVTWYTAPEQGQAVVQAMYSAGNYLFSASTVRPPPRPLPSQRIPIHQVPATTRQHQISTQMIGSPWVSPSTFPIDSKPWSILASPSSSSTAPAWLAVGHEGTSPLSLFFLSTTGELLPSPPTYEYPRKTSIYSLVSPSPLNTHFRSDCTILAGSFDSVCRVFDIRLPSTVPPVLELSDPWSDDALYSIASGGPGGSYVIAGTARNSIQVFDLRYPRTSAGAHTLIPADGVPGDSGGITMFSPTRDKSPVYSLAVEYSRIWAAVDRNTFVLDFEDLGGREVRAIEYYGHAKGDVSLKRSKNRYSR
ncbi:hypothetical protein T439DRAFT_133146 [Meredithblackwellia eburnea MCA 4105]